MKRNILLIALLAMFLVPTPDAQAQQKVFRIGMIGLDTSHVVAFTKVINNPDKNYGCKVVVGYPGGSPDLPSSANRRCSRVPSKANTGDMIGITLFSMQKSRVR